jgi:hypothetical protein
MSAQAWTNELPELEADELLLWAGQPDPKQFRFEASVRAAIGLIPLGFGLAFFILIVSHAPLRAELIPAGLVAAMFCAIGIKCMVTSWHLKRRLREAIYALTDRRALVLNGVGWPATVLVLNSVGWPVTVPLRETSYAFGLDALHNRVRKRRYGRRIDLVFGEEVYQRKGRKRPCAVEIGFLGLTDPGPVIDLLEQYFPRCHVAHGTGESQALIAPVEAPPLQ